MIPGILRWCRISVVAGVRTSTGVAVWMVSRAHAKEANHLNPGKDLEPSEGL